MSFGSNVILIYHLWKMEKKKTKEVHLLLLCVFAETQKLADLPLVMSQRAHIHRFLVRQ